MRQLSSFLSDERLELSLISACLLSRQQYLECRLLVSEEDFALVEHRVIWKVLGDVYAESKLEIADASVVASRCEQYGVSRLVASRVIENALGLKSLGIAATDAAKLVRELSIRRRIQNVGYELVRAARDRSEDVFEIIHRGYSRLVSIEPVVSSGGRRIEEVAREFVASLRDGTGQTVLRTGFPSLDHILVGLHPGDMVIVAGRPGMGKTAFLTSLLLSWGQQGVPVWIASFEMTTQQLIARLLSQISRIPLSYFRGKTAQSSPSTVLRVDESLDFFSSLPIYLDDLSTGSSNLGALIAAMSFTVHLRGVRVVLVDYLQLIEVTGKKFDSREREVAHISRMMKVMAKKLGVVMVCAAQLNRATEARKDHRPLLGDLRESGALEQDADIVMFLYRPEVYGIESIERHGVTEPSAGKLEVIVAKHRHGSTGSCWLSFDGESVSITDPTV